MGAFCYADDPESHLCTYQEIIKAAKTIGITYENPFDPTWINDYQDGWITGTCDGWSSDSPREFGTTLKEQATGLGFDVTCDQEFHVLCCTKMPQFIL